MPGSPSNSRPLQTVGVIAALIGVVGFTVFGWRWGETSSLTPTVIGAAFAAIAVAWTVYAQFR